MFLSAVYRAEYFCPAMENNITLIILFYSVNWNADWFFLTVPGFFLAWLGLSVLRLQL